MMLSFIERLKKWRFINKCYRFDKRKFVKYSQSVRTSGQDHALTSIALYTHIIEKGLTMPETRFGFGQETALKLIRLCRSWKQSSDQLNPFYVTAVKTVLEYHLFHRKAEYQFSEPFLSELESFVKDNNRFTASESLIFNDAKHYFSDYEKSFPEFARSRHSVRCFSNEDIPTQLIIDSIELAQCAPSACNRQSTRVHIITDKTDIAKILSIQSGNRGFGHLTNKLLIITYRISSYTIVKERNLGFIDSGIFTMNLLYALHYHQIGACVLNWCNSPKDDAKLRTIIHIDDNEYITLFIACGRVPDHSFSVAKSQRLKVEGITTVH